MGGSGAEHGTLSPATAGKHIQDLPIFFYAILAGLTVWTALRPADALLALCAFLPLSRILSAWGGLPFPATEPLVLCWLAGALAAAALGKLPLGFPGSAKGACLAFTAVIAASVAVRFSALVISLDHLPSRLLAFISSDYLRGASSFPSLTAAALLLESAALYVLVYRTTGKDSTSWRSALAMSAVGAIAAATLNVVRLVEALLRATAPWSLLAEQLGRPRLNVHYADVNAAGSYFSLGIFLALGLARTRTTRLAAYGWYTGAAVVAIAIWLTGSRAAVLASGLSVLVWAAIALREAGVTRRRIAAGIVALAAVVSVAGAIQLRNPVKPAARTLGYRWELTQVALRMLQVRPVFGIGVGEFYDRSHDFASAELRAAYPHENAHNNFLQIGAELGLVGLAAFAWLLIATLRAGRGWRARLHAGDFLAAGLLFGVATFLETCLAGHPLLTRDVAYPFWIALGLSLAMDPAAADHAGERRSLTKLPAAGIILALAVAVSVPIRSIRERKNANLENVALGLSDWYRDQSGSWIRDVHGPATFFVPSGVPAVVIPMRVDSPTAGPLFVDIVFNGRHADRVRLNPTGWTDVRLLLPEHAQSRFSRIEIRVLGPDGHVPSHDPVVHMGRLVYP